MIKFHHLLFIESLKIQ